MTDNTKHTPTPWAAHMVNTATVNIRAGEISIAAVYRNIGSPVLHDRDGEGDGNAAFIVRAVNSHAALVAALEDAIDRLASVDRMFHRAIGEQQDGELGQIIRGRAALALARGDT